MLRGAVPYGHGIGPTYCCSSSVARKNFAEHYTPAPKLSFEDIIKSKMNLSNYGCQRSFASASKLDDMLLEFQLEMDLNNASGHTEATMETSYTSNAGDCFDDLNDPDTKPSHYIDTNNYGRPRTHSDGGALHSSSWCSYTDNLRHASLLPMFGIAAEVTNSPPTPCWPRSPASCRR